MIVKLLKEIINIDSPSGYTDNVIDFMIKKLKKHKYIIEKTNKGALIVSTVKNPKYMISAHIDTLGGMVKGINSDGTLEITQIGGWPVNSFEGEYISIVCDNKKIIRGTFLLKNPAAHVNREVQSAKRNMSSMFIRLDAESRCLKDTKKLGIKIGDFVCFDTRFEYTKTGFVKSRFMDDKACSAIMLDILLNKRKQIIKTPIAFYFSNYEEVGHGACSGIPDSCKEMLVADMGVVGNGVSGDEYHVSICAKDSSGPYDYKMRKELEVFASKGKIPFKTDIFPYYGSDGSAALRAGNNIRVSLIGPGVSASHGVERVHIKGLKATEDLILAYIVSRKK